MSVIGTVSSFFAAIILPFLSIPLTDFEFNIKYVMIASASAFLGVVFDSLLGSLCQVKYRCTLCGRLTEKKEHCDAPTEKKEGIAFVDNDMVNIFSGFFSAILAALLVLLI